MTINPGRCLLTYHLNWASIGSDNGLSPGRRQAITCTNADLLSVGPVGTNFSEIWIEIYSFWFKKCIWKCCLKKWRPFRISFNVLMYYDAVVCFIYRPILECRHVSCLFNTLRPRQHFRHFADDVFKSISLNENIFISIKISLTFVPKGSINNMPSLVQTLAWRRAGDKPLSEPMIVSLLTHICVTRPQWFKSQTVCPASQLRVFQLNYPRLPWCRNNGQTPLHYYPLWGESIGRRGITLTNGQLLSLVFAWTSYWLKPSSFWSSEMSWSSCDVTVMSVIVFQKEYADHVNI